MRATQALYFLSDQAYDYLIQLSREYGYTKTTSRTSHGLSDFIHDLVTQPRFNLNDNRPDHIKEYHEASIRFGIAPEWKDPSQPRRVRCLRLYTTTKAHIIHFAYQYQILSKDAYIQGRASITKPNIAISYILEGIGLEWLVPNNFPRKVRANVSTKVPAKNRRNNVIGLC